MYVYIQRAFLLHCLCGCVLLLFFLFFPSFIHTVTLEFSSRSCSTYSCSYSSGGPSRRLPMYTPPPPPPPPPPPLQHTCMPSPSSSSSSPTHPFASSTPPFLPPPRRTGERSIIETEVGEEGSICIGWVGGWMTIQLE